MVDSTGLGDVVDECAAGAAELVVEDDAGGEGEEALEDAFAQAGEGAGAVAFEGEQVFAGPEDAFDALADRGEVRAVAGFVFASWADDRGVQLADLEREFAAGVAFVAEQRLAAVASGASEQFETDIALVAFGRGERERPWRAVRSEDRVQPEAPEIAGVRAAPAVVRGIGKPGALDCLAAARALHRGRVDEQQIVVESWAAAGVDPQQPLDRVRQTAAPLEIPGLDR